MEEKKRKKGGGEEEGRDGGKGGATPFAKCSLQFLPTNARFVQNKMRGKKGEGGGRKEDRSGRGGNAGFQGFYPLPFQLVENGEKKGKNREGEFPGKKRKEEGIQAYVHTLTIVVYIHGNRKKKKEKEKKKKRPGRGREGGHIFVSASKVMRGKKREKSTEEEKGKMLRQTINFSRYRVMTLHREEGKGGERRCFWERGREKKGANHCNSTPFCHK